MRRVPGFSVSSCLSRWVMASLCVLAAQGANAQRGDIEVEPSAEPLSCLTSIRPESKLPVYPDGVPPGTQAVVRVRLSFSSNDQAPTVDLRFNNSAPAFAAAVQSYVTNYRLPCLRPGAEFVAEQEFQFVQNLVPAILESPPRGPDGELAWPPECLTAIKNAPPPILPADSAINGRATAGTALVRLKFIAPDAPPEVSFLYNGGDVRMERSIRNSVLAYRMPCLKAGDAPLVATQQFDFEFEGENTAHLKPALTLVQLLGLVKDLNTQAVRFDFTTMGCPFQLGVAPYQPYAKNSVSQLGEKNAGRREFIEWLRNVTFTIPARAMKTAIGHGTTVTVPCLLLDLS